jgi:hypothetical protein
MVPGRVLQERHMISALDTHETVKNLIAVGFTDAQAELNIEYSNEDRHCRFATRDGGDEGRARQMDRRSRIRPVATILAVVKLFPVAHP